MGRSTMPIQVIKMLQRNAQLDDREVVRDYEIGNRGAVQLSEKQKVLLERYRKANELISSGKFNKRQTLNLLCNAFGYNISTASRDYYAAQYIYGSGEKINFNYLLAIHIERIDEAIRKIEEAGKYELLDKVLKCYTEALKLIPNTGEADTTPAALIFNFTSASTGNDLLNENTTIDVVAEVLDEEMGDDTIKIDDIK